MNDMYKKENNELVTKLLQKRFLNSYKGKIFPGSENLISLELIIDNKCNLACKYCYYDKYGNQYFTKESTNKNNILDNARKVADWLKTSNVKPQITLFSGDILYRPIGLELIKIFLDYTKKENGGILIIPTNATFINDPKKIKDIENIIKDHLIFFSLSIEGLECEHSRPYKGKKKENRDEKYYEKAFKFAKKNNVGFHPMIHSTNIRDWKKNLVWFFDMYKKYDMSLDLLYLLEVRNSDWTAEDIKIYGEFIEFLIEETFRNPCKSNKKLFFNLMFEQKGLNILSNMLFEIGRGIGCSLQSMIALRLGDMTIVPCHRLAYKWFEIGKLKLPEFEVYDVTKPELMIGIDSCKSSNFPKCDHCMINDLCFGGCLGAQYETSYDLFYPDEVVCALMHIKVVSLIKGFKTIGIFDEILARISSKKIEQLLKINEMFC